MIIYYHYYDIAKVILTWQNNHSCWLFQEVLNFLTRIWIFLWFRISQDSEYASGCECAMILNIQGLRIFQVYTGFRICLNNSWICLNMPESVWIYLNVPEYTRIFVNMPKSAWMAFVLHFPIFFTIPFLLEHVDTYLIVYRRLEVIESLMRPEEEAVFLKRQNLIFSVAARSILFVFYFRLSIVRSKV